MGGFRLGRLLRPRRPKPRGANINLALQGGGAHGAFTWGVLDRLLEDETLDFDGISGASAGAVNACVFATGWVRNRHQGAREALREFWEHVGGSGQMSPLQPTPLDYLFSGWNRDRSPGYVLVRGLAKVASPYQLNPAGLNPLTPLLEQHIDFAALRKAKAPRLFVSATNVHSGKLRVLGNAELTPEALLASACLPLMFQAVELDGEYYWDGGYTANPALFPLIAECAAGDLLLIQLNRRWESEVPTKVPAIVNRVNEICFNANLLRELQMLALLKRELRPAIFGGAGLQRRISRLHFHHIGIEGALDGAGSSSPMNTEWPFLKHLRDQGRMRAQAWLEEHRADLGQRSTLDLQRYL